MVFTSQPLQIYNIIAVICLPLFAIYFALGTPLTNKTAIWAVVYYFLSGIGITAGYHRLWSHRSYIAGIPLQIYLAITGAACFQGSIREWCKDHRMHHRYVDTDQDPYSISKGLFYAHMGWLFFKPKAGKIQVDITDLDDNKVVIWQTENFFIIAITAGLIFPSLIAGLFWNDWKGGFVYAGALRIFFFQQATFCVNSLAHWLGDQPYDSKHSPRDHLFTALVTFGEGYHNFHHEFPSDYRNGIKWNQYDPSKWSIWIWQKLGLASNLRRFSQNTIRKCEYQRQLKRLDEVRSELVWGTEISQLPLLTWADFQHAVNNGRQLVSIAGFIYQIESFIPIHPGGEAIIRSYVGKDATAAFHGGIYSHSNAAHNLLDEFRYGALLGGGEIVKDKDHGTI